MAGGTGSSCKQRKTGSSRWELPVVHIAIVCGFWQGASGRTHTGLVAQDVEQALRDSGLTGQDFAAFVKTPRKDGSADYGLRYEELITLCIRQIQRLQTRVRKLEETA